MFANRHARKRHGKHSSKGRAKQAIGRRYSRRPTLDAPVGASNTLNFLLDVNHVQKEVKICKKCMDTFYYTCMTTGVGGLPLEALERRVDEVRRSCRCVHGSKFGEVS